MESHHGKNFTNYKVVGNDEEQYSIWPARQIIPTGWHDTGAEGSKDDCLVYIREMWTEMVPLSLRQKMDVASCRLLEAKVETAIREVAFLFQPPSPLERFSRTDLPVEVMPGAEKTIQALLARIHEGYMEVRFVGTQDEMELRLLLDPEAVQIQAADSGNQRGVVHLEGNIIPDYQNAWCIMDISLETFSGLGRLHLMKR